MPTVEKDESKRKQSVAEHRAYELLLSKGTYNHKTNKQNKQVAAGRADETCKMYACIQPNF